MRRAHSGVAVIMALGVVALAAIAVTAMMSSQGTWARERQLESEHAQAQVLIQSGVDWARAVLGDDRRLTSVDHLKEPWAMRLPPMPVDNGELSGYIEDQQGMFNINDLAPGGKVDERQLQKFRRLLSLLGLPPSLAGAAADWIDTDNAEQPGGGAEDEYYLSRTPPYLAANRPMTDISELARVAGYDEATRIRLRPFVTALPVSAPINVNTASAEVLAAVIEGLDIDGARAIVARRERGYYRNAAELSARLPQGVTISNTALNVSSNYFLAHVRVTIGGAEARGEALLSRADIGWPAIVWRKFE